MKKIVVFDCGWGGEVVGDFIEEELTVVDVVREIDWRHAPYAKKDDEEVFGLMEEALGKYVGKVELIVVANMEAGRGVEQFRKKYPEQKIERLEIEDEELLERRGERILWLAGEKELERGRAKMQEIFGAERIVEVDCGEWEQRIDNGLLTESEVRRKLNLVKWGIDTVVLGEAYLWEIREMIERTVGRQALIIDQRENLLRKLVEYTDLKFKAQYLRWH